MEECIFDASQLLGKRSIDLIPAAVYVCDMEGRIKLYNRRAVQLWGREPKLDDPHELFSGSYKLFYSDGRFMAHAQNFMAEVLRSGQPLHHREAVIERPDGSRSAVIASIDPLRDEKGNLAGAVSVFQDVTELKQAEAALRESNELRQALFQASPAAIVALDQQGRVTQWNPAAERMFGWSAQETLGQSPPHIPTDARGEYLELFTKAINGQMLSAVEVTRHRKDGSVIQLALSTATLRDARGEVQGAMGILTDITERKRADEALRESEERYRSLFEHNLAGVYLSSAAGRKPLDCNLAFAQMFGYDSREEILERPPEEFFMHEGDREASWRILEREGKLTNYEAELRRKDGSSVWVLANATRVGRDGAGLMSQGTLIDITERKRAEAALRESEARYRDLVENSQDLICTHDLEGRVLSANPASARLLGYAAEELVGMNMRDLVAPEAYHLFDEYLASIQKEGQSSGLMPVRTSTGKKRIWEYQSTLRREGVAQPIVRGFARDVTEREQAETALRESEERFRRLVEISPEAILVSCEGKVVFVNPAGLKLFGAQSVDEILGRPALEFVHTDFREVVRQRMQLTHGSGVPVPPLEEQWVRLDGTIVDVEAIAAPFAWEGKPAVQVVVRDISERKQAEEALHKSEQALRTSFLLLQAIAEGTTDVLFVKDLESRYLIINSAGVGVLGQSVQEIIGKSDHELLPREVARGFRESDEVVMASGKSHTFEEFMQGDGVARTFQTTKSPYRDHTGSVIGIIGIARDITELKLLEEELRQAQKMEAVGQLVSGIAHNFNNALTAITLFAGLLNSKLPPAGAERGYLGEIGDVVERASSLVSQLMTFSRKEKPVQHVLDLNGILSGQARMIEQLIPENIELKMLPGKELDLVRTDGGQMAEALVNLVLNAKDAMPTGGKLILETSNVTLDKNYTDRIAGLAPGRYVLLSVSDTGKGMDGETKRRVFEPFFTTKPPGEGTGLGLAVVYATVKQNGGYVSVYSEKGMGTTFKIYLPAVSEKMEQEEVATGRLEGTEQVVADQGTILLVEDERSIREAAREYLNQLGYKVLLAGNGQEALRVAQLYKRGIDLMLTDVVMPRLDGPELADQMKRIHPETKVLYMSGYSAEILADHLRLTGQKALLRKPFSLEGLAERVRQTIRGQGHVPGPKPTNPSFRR